MTAVGTFSVTPANAGVQLSGAHVGMKLDASMRWHDAGGLKGGKEGWVRAD
jgi:hypothetical protein